MHYAAAITPANIIRRLKLRQPFFPISEEIL
jgi:hypothetical protein